MTTDRDALRALMPYLTHFGSCDLKQGGECSCGLRAALGAAPPALDVDVLDRAVEELRGRGYTIPEASTIASTYHRAILDKAGRPTPSDLRGLAPGIAQGLSSEGYVRSIRDAEPPSLDVDVLARALERNDREYKQGGWWLVGPNGWGKLAEGIAREYSAILAQTPEDGA